MKHQSKKNPTSGGESGNSKAIHTCSANDPYSKLIFENEKALLFSVLVLKDLDERLNDRSDEFLPKSGTDQLALYHALIKLGKRGRR